MKKEDLEKNVVVAVFKVESEAYQAMTELRQAAGGETYLVSAAALVKKEKDRCVVLDGFDTGVQTANDTLVGGLVGMLVGALAGPVGMLLGASTGTLIGTTVDTSDAVFGASMLEQIAAKLDEGMVAIVALAVEENNDAIDAKLSAYETIIARFDAEAVAEEVDEAYKMQEEMTRQAVMQLRKKKEEEAEQMLEENSEILRKGFSK